MSVTGSFGDGPFEPTVALFDVVSQSGHPGTVVVLQSDPDYCAAATTTLTAEIAYPKSSQQVELFFPVAIDGTVGAVNLGQDVIVQASYSDAHCMSENMPSVFDQGTVRLSDVTSHAVAAELDVTDSVDAAHVAGSFTAAPCNRPKIGAGSSA